MKTVHLISGVVLSLSLQGCQSWWPFEEEKPEPRTTAPDPYFSSTSPQGPSVIEDPRWNANNAPSVVRADTAPAHNLNSTYGQNAANQQDPYFSSATRTVTAPTYTAPTYTAPSHQVPSYQAPSYSAPAVTAPQVQIQPPAPVVNKPKTETGTYYSEYVSETQARVHQPYYGNSLGSSVVAPRTATLTTPQVQTPRVSTPVVTQPVVQAPVVQQPVVQAPVVRTPQVQMQAPVVHTPQVQMQAPVVQQPVVQAPVVRTPQVQMHTPVVQQPSYTQPQAMVQQPVLQVPTPRVQPMQVTTPVVTAPNNAPAAQLTPNSGPTKLVMGLHTNAKPGSIFGGNLQLHLVDHSDPDNEITLDFKGKNALLTKNVAAGTYRATKLTYGSRSLPLNSNFITLVAGHTTYAGNMVVDISKSPHDVYSARIRMEDHHAYTVNYLGQQNVNVTGKQLLRAQAKPTSKGTGKFQESESFFGKMFGG